MSDEEPIPDWPPQPDPLPYPTPPGPPEWSGSSGEGETTPEDPLADAQNSDVHALASRI